MSKKIYVACGRYYSGYISWLEPLGFKLTNNISESDAVFFAGGEDICPSIYNDACGQLTNYNWHRDNEELAVFRASKNKLKIGVCRGGQLLTALNGYKLVQHVHHPYMHDVHTIEGDEIPANSLHHQQFLLQPNQILKTSNYKLMAWTNRLSPIHLNGEDEDYNFAPDYKEPEIVVYESAEHGKSIAIQAHPEALHNKHRFVKYCQKIVINNYS